MAHEMFINSQFGYCYYTLGKKPLIYNLYVYPQYRKQGHSKRLLRYVINEILSQTNCTEIYIEANPKENSISKDTLIGYYVKMGLTIKWR